MLLSFVGIAALSSCNKDNEKIDARATLIGTWQVNVTNIDVKINDKSIKDFFISTGATETEANLYAALYEQLFKSVYDIQATVTFKDDNTYMAISDIDTTDILVVARSLSRSVMVKDTVYGTWSLNDKGDELTMDADTEDLSVLKIESMNKAEMKMLQKEVQEEDFNGDSSTEKVAVSINLTFKK